MSFSKNVYRESFVETKVQVQCYVSTTKYHFHFVDGADRQNVHRYAHFYWMTCNVINTHTPVPFTETSLHKKSYYGLRNNKNVVAALTSSVVFNF